MTHQVGYIQMIHFTPIIPHSHSRHLPTVFICAISVQAAFEFITQHSFCITVSLPCVFIAKNKKKTFASHFVFYNNLYYLLLIDKCNAIIFTTASLAQLS